MERASEFARVQKARQIETTMFMATCFRTGSTLLGRLLEIQTGLAFHREAFNTVSTWQSLTDDGLRAEMNRLFSPVRSNVFASKIMWPQRNRLAEFLQINARDFKGFRNSFPNPKFFCLFRRDKVAQAVSFHIARHTGAWDSNKTATRTHDSVPYSFSKINTYYMHFLSFELLWSTFFEQLEDNCIRIYYEDLIQDPKSVVETVLNQLNLKFDNKKWTDNLPLSKQSGELSRTFTGRFLDDLNTYSSDAFLPGRLLGQREPQ